jgi:hypothetical protein
MIKHKALSLKELVGIFLEVGEDSAVKLENLFVPFFFQIDDNLLAPDAPRAKDENFLVTRRGVFLEPGCKLAEPLNPGIMRAPKSPELYLIAVPRIDEGHGLSRAQQVMPA